MEDLKLHRFEAEIGGIEVPERLNNPFEYAPHPLAVLAAEQVKRYVAGHSEWAGELARGKMLGVLVVSDASGKLGFLAAYSGILAGSNNHAYFVPPIYDLLTPNGEFKQGEAQISAINAQIAQLESSDSLRMAKRALQKAEEAKTTAINAYKLTMSEAKANREARRKGGVLSAEEKKALIAESQFQKAELKRIRQRHDATIEEKKAAIARLQSEISALKARRKTMSEALQERIFRLFVVNSGEGERRDLIDVFATFYQANPTLQASAIPPSGSGECCAPKLLQYAFNHQLKPLCIAEFWWGNSPAKSLLWGVSGQMPSYPFAHASRRGHRASAARKEGGCHRRHDTLCRLVDSGGKQACRYAHRARPPTRQFTSNHYFTRDWCTIESGAQARHEHFRHRDFGEERCGVCRFASRFRKPQH